MTRVYCLGPNCGLPPFRSYSRPTTSLTAHAAEVQTVELSSGGGGRRGPLLCALQNRSHAPARLGFSETVFWNSNYRERPHEIISCQTPSRFEWSNSNYYNIVIIVTFIFIIFVIAVTTHWFQWLNCIVYLVVKEFLSDDKFMFYLIVPVCIFYLNSLFKYDRGQGNQFKFTTEIVVQKISSLRWVQFY